jgi:hypothetical protein
MHSDSAGVLGMVAPESPSGRRIKNSARLTVLDFLKTFTDGKPSRGPPESSEKPEK